jgi:hypothetical protein
MPGNLKSDHAGTNVPVDCGRQLGVGNMLNQENFGSGNILDSSGLLSDSLVHQLLGQYDPRLVREEIGVTAVSAHLFPTLRSGVRFWPYLLVAHELRDEQNNSRIEAHLRRLRRLQRGYQEKGLYARAFGPRTLGSFQAYRAMYEKLMDSHTEDAEGLKAFVSGRLRYRGNPQFFLDNKNKWRTLFRRALGTPGQQFGRLLDRLYKGTPNWRVVDLAITTLLRENSYDQWLRRGALCYAFLRCVYGITESVEGIRSFYPSREWAKNLEKMLCAPPPDLRTYTRFLPIIQKSVESPALKHVHQHALEENRRVLAGLGFHVFYRMYVAHSPYGVV